MKDLKQIQEFFSKPLEENTTDWPKEVSSRYGDIIFRLVKVMPDRAKYELIDAETGKTWEVGGRVYGTVNQLKASAEDTIKPQGGRQLSQFESVNEEDPTDIIAMDIPLFLRMLEYAREDAQEDVDLHDVTQRATELSKAKPFLSMEDYNEIVAAPQEIDEDDSDDTWESNKEKAREFIKKYPDNVNVGFAKAYLAIDDSVDANLYWNKYNLKNITSGIDEAARTEKGKKVPAKYLKGLKATGAKGSKEAMKKEIDRFAGKDEYKKDWDADYTDKGKRVKTKQSAATKAFKARFGESISGLIRQALQEGGDPSDKALANKAKKSGIPKGILRQVFNRGKAAWNTGHRPGSTQDQWAMGRVNSFITGSGGARKADADLWKEARKARGKKD